MSNHYMTYGNFRDTFMSSLTGTPANGDERKFRTLLIRALSKVINEGKVALPDIQRIQDVVSRVPFTLLPFESTVTVARLMSGQKIPIIDKNTYDVQYRRTYPNQTFYATGDVVAPYICIIDQGWDENGNKSYVLPAYSGATTGDPIKVQLTIAQRPPQNAPVDDTYWLDTLPIFPDCPDVIVTVMKALVKLDAGNTEDYISLFNIARNDLNEWLARESMGTLYGANIVGDAYLQNSITSFM